MDQTFPTCPLNLRSQDIAARENSAMSGWGCSPQHVCTLPRYLFRLPGAVLSLAWRVYQSPHPTLLPHRSPGLPSKYCAPFQPLELLPFARCFYQDQRNSPISPADLQTTVTMRNPFAIEEDPQKPVPREAFGWRIYALAFGAAWVYTLEYASVLLLTIKRPQQCSAMIQRSSAVLSHYHPSKQHSESAQLAVPVSHPTSSQPSRQEHSSASLSEPSSLSVLVVAGQ